MDHAHVELSALESWEDTRVEVGDSEGFVAPPPAELAKAVLDNIQEGLRDDDSTSPPTLGRFRLLRQIGSGAMGVVFEGFDPDLDRRVALKVLQPEAAASDSLQARGRMLREAKALARLRHPHVTMVYEVGTSDEGAPFIAMELVEGRTLARWLRSRPRTCHEIIEVFLQAGRGLAAAHEAGLVHRDFKPDNVIIDDRGQARVVDFGLARSAGLADLLPTLDEGGDDNVPVHLTCTGAVLGTPAYMAPEQFEGSAVDSSSDQFSFCVSLFEALYGRRPYPGNDLPSLQRSLLGGKPVGPRRGVPRRLYRVLRRGLCTEPSSRHSSMEALLDALQACMRRSRVPRPALLVAGLVAAMVAGASLHSEGAQSTPATACVESAVSDAVPSTEVPVVARAAGPAWNR